MTALLVGRLRELATQTHLLEKKVDALGWMAANGPQTLKSMTRAQAHIPARKSCGRSSRQCKERQRKNESFR